MWTLAVLLAGFLALAAPADAVPEEADVSVVVPGIQVHAAERLGYRRDGMNLDIDFGKPAVIAVADKPMGWGYFQFPEITRSGDGAICANWHMAPDAAVGYGTEPGRAASRDGGKTWSPLMEAPDPHHILLPNGDGLSVVWPAATPVEKLKLPEPLGVFKSNYGGQPFTYYRHSDLPPELQGVPLRRKAKGSDRWLDERARLDDPIALRYHFQGMFPVLWLGDIRVVSDKSLVSAVYPGVRINDGKPDPLWHTFVYRSTDSGHSWQVQGRLLYEGDPTADPKHARRAGFTEPALEVLPDGSLLCVMRTTDGTGIGPMYRTRSTDLGRTWTKPIAFSKNGVLPRLLQLENGVLVLSSGRPGVQVRFSVDGKGEHWTKPFEMMSHKPDAYGASCGYTNLLATGRDRFLLIYSDFRYITETGELRKAIKVREVRVVNG